MIRLAFGAKWGTPGRPPRELALGAAIRSGAISEPGGAAKAFGGVED